MSLRDCGEDVALLVALLLPVRCRGAAFHFGSKVQECLRLAFDACSQLFVVVCQ